MAEIKVYVNWREKKLCTGKEIKNMIEEEVEQRFKDREEFGDWLDDNYYSTELFDMNEEQKATALKLYREYLQEEVEDRYDDSYGERYIEID